MTPSVPTRNKVLYIDDDVLTSQLMQHYFRRHGYEITMYSNPADALDFVRSNPKRFDLVVTDLSMPMMSGLELAQALHKLEPALPVILATAGPSAETEAAALGLGIRGFVDKCRPMTEQLHVIDDVLQQPG